MKRWVVILSVCLVPILQSVPLANAQNIGTGEARVEDLPDMRWNHMSNHSLWNRAAIDALATHGQALTRTVPADIGAWCANYTDGNAATRQAFWVGFMSSLAKYESTYKPRAVGGGGKWFGLLQISPATARGYGCRAGTGEALKVGAANLSCAVRIMAHTVPRDGVIHARDSKWRGVAADWGPLRVRSKRDEMRAWLKKQPYCKPDPNVSLRPKLREGP